MNPELAATLPTKTYRDENFPVASRLIARPLREAVLGFYRFVRAADDVADSPLLSPEEKLERLDAMERALLVGDSRLPMAAELHALDRRFGAGRDEALLLMAAFRQDALKQRYDSWEDLVGYCRLSAVPVGRFLLRLHGEGDAPSAGADALCIALQVLNHLQDLAKDREELDRIYLPAPWLERAGGEAQFFEPANAAPRRAVLDAILDQVDALLDKARSLVGAVSSRRLAAESAVTLALALRLSAALRGRDPLLARVALGKRDFAFGFASGLGALALRRRDSDAALTRAIVARSGSSFRLGMARLQRERRRAIHAVYAFCRIIDDIADGAAPPAEKKAFLAAWRREIEALGREPETPVGRELARAAAAFDLPAQEFHALLDGMEGDAADEVRIADDAALDLYCRRVAGSVGVLSVRIFGAGHAHEFALGLGRTLQLVNVLRDVDEDARIGRLYLPLSRLRSVGIEEGPADAIVADPRIAPVCEALAQEAQDGFDRADAMLAGLDRRSLTPAVLMMESYRLLLSRLRERGFVERGPRLRLSRPDKFRLLASSLWMRS